MNHAETIITELQQIAAIYDRLYRDAQFDQVEDELRRLRGGCRCERLLHAATALEGDEGEAARMLLNILHRDVTMICEYRGPRAGLAAGLAVEAERLTRLVGGMDETESD